MSHPLELFRFCPVCGSNKFIENNNQSKRCETCGFIDYINPKAAVVAVITNTRGDILVCRRAKDPAKGTLDMPGGFTDLNETAEEAVIREVKEETGLTVTATRYLFSLPNTYKYSGLNVPTMDLFFECDVLETSGITAQDDVTEAWFIPRNEIDPSQFGHLYKKGFKESSKRKRNKTRLVFISFFCAEGKLRNVSFPKQNSISTARSIRYFRSKQQPR